MRLHARIHRLPNLSNRPRIRYARRHHHRRGVVAVLAALMLVMLFGFMAFAIDVGYITNMRTEIQASVDSAALAGAGALAYSEEQAIAAAQHYATVNDVTGKTIDRNDLTIELGRWDKVGRVFQNGATPFAAVHVAAQSNNRELFFGRVLGTSRANARAEAVAVMQPRDIMLVLDFSGSMRGAKIDALRDAVDVFVSAM